MGEHIQDTLPTLIYLFQEAGFDDFAKATQSGNSLPTSFR